MRMLTLVLAVLVLAVLALSALIGCQSKPMVGSDGQSGREGIKVRGDWVIEVKNPDGSLVSRREFENDLTINGKKNLGFFLARKKSVGRWQIFLSAGEDKSYCESQFDDPYLPIGGSTYNTGCLWIIEPEETHYGISLNRSLVEYPLPGHLSNNLTVWVNDQLQIEINGTITATDAGFISEVGTQLKACPADVPVFMGCDDNDGTDFFTRTSGLDQPVLAGQQILATVLLEFMNDQSP